MVYPPFFFNSHLNLSVCFSESDVALIIKYQFFDEEEEQTNYLDPKNKKRKTTDAKRSNVMQYSYIKLPASCFAQYLDLDCPSFIKDCLRYSKISSPVL